MLWGEKGLDLGGKRSPQGRKKSLIGGIKRAKIHVALASFTYADFWGSRVFCNFGAQPVDILLEKFRGSFIIWSPDTLEQIYLAA